MYCFSLVMTLQIFYRLVWATAMSYIILLDYYPLKNIEDWIFSDTTSGRMERYLTSIFLAWVNSRCVSFSLDRIWGRVEREQGLVEGFLMLSAYCFYLPLGIHGPLVTSRTFKKSFTDEVPPLSSKIILHAVIGVLRYLLWTAVAEIFTYILFQGALKYHVSYRNQLSHLVISDRKIIYTILFDINY